VCRIQWLQKIPARLPVTRSTESTSGSVRPAPTVLPRASLVRIPASQPQAPTLQPGNPSSSLCQPSTATRTPEPTASTPHGIEAPTSPTVVGSPLGSAAVPEGSGVASPSIGTSPVASSAHASPPSPASASPVRPRTQLQAGIQQPKVYTDGTIRYGCYTSTGEPHNLDEALSDKKMA
jgi:hypothetical protein